MPFDANPTDGRWFRSLNDILEAKQRDRQKAIDIAEKKRWPDGFKCRRCEHDRYSAIQQHTQLIRCDECGYVEYATGHDNVENWIHNTTHRRRIDVDAPETAGDTVAGRVLFCANRAFAFDEGETDRGLIALLQGFIERHCGRYALYVGGPFYEYLESLAPSIVANAAYRIVDRDLVSVPDDGPPRVRPDEIPSDIDSIFLAETRVYYRMMMRQRLGQDVRAACPDVLAEIAAHDIPACGWRRYEAIIYPIVLPDISVAPGVDMVLLDAPGRMLAGPPIGVGYVNKALKRTSVRFTTIDIDTVCYHRYQVSRLFDDPGVVTAPNGFEMPDEPWHASNEDMWVDPGAVEYFRRELDWIMDELRAARPKAVGMSLHQLNRVFFEIMAREIRETLPDILIVAGGFTANNPDAGPRTFPNFDYMVINDADEIIGGLAESIARGERPKNMTGVISRFDDPDHKFQPAPQPMNLDKYDMPDYDWLPLDAYRASNGYIRIPIISSRGCKWSNCTFCSERFAWRVRSPERVVDEMEWYYNRGLRDFMFQESDFNGRPEVIEAMCDEVVRRKLYVNLTGQNRINNRCGPEFYPKMKAAGFHLIRFGVDAWSRNTLKLQRKGYTKDHIRQHLLECHKAGIRVDVNVVIGVPRETEEDVDESIEFLLEMKPYINLVANINPLGIGNGSIYWEEPEEHSIVFRGDRNELYQRNFRFVEPDMWYSTDPYIDQNVRMDRLKRVITALIEGGMNLDPYAQAVVTNNVKRIKGADADNEGGDEEFVKNVVYASKGVTRKPWEVENFGKVCRIGEHFYAVPRDSLPDSTECAA